jgi:hypothetical protein
MEIIKKGFCLKEIVEKDFQLNAESFEQFE